MKIKKVQTQSRERVMVGFGMKGKNGVVLRLARGVEHVELNSNDILIGFENQAKTSKTGKQAPRFVFYKPISK